MAFWNINDSVALKQQHKWIISFGDALTPNLTGGDRGIPSFLAKSVDLPTFEIGITSAKYMYSHNFNFPKRLVWKPITITFYDALLEDTTKSYALYPVNKPNSDPESENSLKSFKLSTQSFFYWLVQTVGYVNPREDEESDENKLKRFIYTFKQNFKVNLTGPNGTLNIHQLYDRPTGPISAIKDPQNLKKNETWRLYNPIISDIRYDKMDYSTDGPMTVTVTIHYDWADLVPVYAVSQEAVPKPAATPAPAAKPAATPAPTPAAPAPATTPAPTPAAPAAAPAPAAPAPAAAPAAPAIANEPTKEELAQPRFAGLSKENVKNLLASEASERSAGFISEETILKNTQMRIEAIKKS